MSHDEQKVRQQFFDEFGKKVNDTVHSLEMICIQADKETFADLKLTCTSLSGELWGLLVFCEKGLYFYVHPYESMMTVMLRQAAHGDPPKEQLLTLHTIPELRFTVYPRSWYDILLGSARDRLVMSYKDAGGRTRCADIQCQGKAESVLDKINCQFVNIQGLDATSVIH